MKTNKSEDYIVATLVILFFLGFGFWLNKNQASKANENTNVIRPEVLSPQDQDTSPSREPILLTQDKSESDKENTPLQNNGPKPDQEKTQKKKIDSIQKDSIATPE